MKHEAVGFMQYPESTLKKTSYLQGRQFDANGDLRDWWEKETKKKFLEKAKCIIHQYGNYSVPEVGLSVSVGQRCKLVYVPELPNCRIQSLSTSYFPGF